MDNGFSAGDPGEPPTADGAIRRRSRSPWRVSSHRVTPLSRLPHRAERSFPRPAGGRVHGRLNAGYGHGASRRRGLSLSDFLLSHSPRRPQGHRGPSNFSAAPLTRHDEKIGSSARRRWRSLSRSLTPCVANAAAFSSERKGGFLCLISTFSCFMPSSPASNFS
jgi:hypothetical protein